MVSVLVSLALSLVFAAVASAETHSVTFLNYCGFGYPVLIGNGALLANGTDYTSNGPINSAISYLQTGDCLYNGEQCTLIELNIDNPTCPGCGPVGDISLISPHAFSVASSFEFYGGDGSCDGIGAGCASASCDTAFFDPNDTEVQRACEIDNVNVLITFCGPVTTEFTSANPGSLSGANTPSNDIDQDPSSSETHTASSVKSSPTSTTPKAAPPSTTATKPTSSAAPVNVAPAPSVSASSSAAAVSPTVTCKRSSSSKKRSVNTLAHSRSRARARAFSH